MNNRLFYASDSYHNREISKSSFKEDKPKINIKEKKDNTIKSLNEVEYFLNSFNHFKHYLHLYKFFK